MNVFDLSAKITMDINGYLKSMNTAKAVALSTFSVMGSAVSGFLDDSVETGKRFDASMSQVAATMGKSMEEMANETGHADTAFGEFDGTLREFAQYMGRNTAFTASQAADALNYMALAGYDTQESMDMLPNVLNLAAAGNMDLAKASDMVTDTQTAFRISAKRTNQMVDEMAKAASTGNTSVEQLGDAFLVVGGLAAELNGGMVELADGTTAEVDGIQELEIALTAMANAGVKGSEAGTHMRNMLLKLASPTSDGTKRLEEMGVAVFDTEGNMRSLSDVFGDLNKSLSTMTQQEKIQAISDLFNTRDLASAEALLNAVGSDWDEIGESILGAQGAAQKMADTQLDNLAGDTKLFESALEGAQIALSDAMTPALREMKQFGTEAILILTEKFQELSPEMQTAIALLGDFGGKALSVAPQVTGFVSNLAQMRIAQKMAGTESTGFIGVLKRIGPAMGIASAAIAVGAVLYVNYRRRIQEASQEQKDFADSMAAINDAYDTTHDQIEVLVSGQNEYINTTDRIAQLEAYRAEVANENIAAQKNLEDAQSQLNETTAELTEQQTKYNEAQDYNATLIGINRESITVLEEKQKSLTDAVASANETYEQTSADLELINSTLDTLYAEQEAATAAVDGTTAAYAQFANEIPADVVESAGKIVTAVLGMQESLTGSVQSIGNWFDKVAEQEKQSAEVMKQNLRDQIAHVRTWESDLAFLADKGINKEFLKYLSDMGPAASEYVVAMKDDVLAGGQATVDEWNALYKEKLDLESGVNEEANDVYAAIGRMEAGSQGEFDKVIRYFGLESEKAGEGITLGLINSLNDGVEAVKSAGEDVGEGAIDGLDEGAGVNSPSWKSKLSGGYIGTGLINGINGQLAGVFSAGSSLGSHAINGANSVDLYGSGYNIGYWFDMGMQNGINAYAYAVANAAENTAQMAVSRTRATMQVSSPSKVGDYIGEMWDRGLEGGMVRNADRVVSAAEDMANRIVDKTNDTMQTPDFGFGISGDSDNSTNSGGYSGSFAPVLNIYGSEGQDVRALAEIVSQELANMFREVQAVWA